MRYMMMVMGDKDYEAGATASEQLQAKMGEFIGKLASQGIFIDGNGMLPTRHGFKASGRNGKITFTDGPFSESKEIIGGYAIVEVQSQEQARQITRDFIDLHAQNGVPNCDCMIRRLEDAPEAE